MSESAGQQICRYREENRTQPHLVDFGRPPLPDRLSRLGDRYDLKAMLAEIIDRVAERVKSVGERRRAAA